LYAKSDKNVDLFYKYQTMNYVN